jgi:ribosomal protein S18 acetylase RimI-like enzyme
MSALSNLFRPRDAGVPPVFRPARRGEVEPAMRWVVGSAHAPAGDEQVLDFLSFALDRGIDVNATWVAEVSGRVEWAVLPVVSPGRTMLLFTPVRMPARRDRAALVTGLADAVTRWYAGRGVILSQLLVEPKERALIAAYHRAGYGTLAELLYLQASIRGNEPFPALPDHLSVRTYAPETHAAFAEAITRSYASSLDCPELNGLRDVEDVLAGHKSAGDFDPRLWFVLCEGSTPAAVLLLSRSAGHSSVELVYLGVAADRRGHGYGEHLLRRALAVTALEGRQYLSLAVDARNAPALGLYYRHGLARVGSRAALVRDLRGLGPATGVSAPAEATIVAAPVTG